MFDCAPWAYLHGAVQDPIHEHTSRMFRVYCSPALIQFGMSVGMCKAAGCPQDIISHPIFIRPHLPLAQPKEETWFFTNCTTLVLSRNPFGVHGLSALLPMLTRMPQLASVSMQRCRGMCSDDAATKEFASLSKCKKLDLSHNLFGDEGLGRHINYPSLVLASK